MHFDDYCCWLLGNCVCVCVIFFLIDWPSLNPTIITAKKCVVVLCKIFFFMYHVNYFENIYFNSKIISLEYTYIIYRRIIRKYSLKTEWTYHISHTNFSVRVFPNKNKFINFGNIENLNDIINFMFPISKIHDNYHHQ